MGRVVGTPARLLAIAALVFATLTACDDQSAVDDNPAPQAQRLSEASAPSETSEAGSAPEPAEASAETTVTVPALESSSSAATASNLAVATLATPTSGAATVDAATGTTVPAVVDDLSAISAALEPDGTLALPAALAMVAASYRPLPGVTPAAAVVSDSGAALRTVVAHLDQLSSDQREAVSSMIDTPGVSPEEAADGEGLLAVAAGLVTLSSARFTDILGTGVPSDVRITLVELPDVNPDGTRNFATPQTHATALAITSTPDDRYDECRIRINVDAAAASAVGPTFTAAIAQETFHCFQFAQRPNGDGVPLWAFEGAAAFAGEAFAEGTTRSTPWWTRWITEPERPLRQRTLDALGFFALVDRAGLDAHALAMVLLSDASPESVRRRLDDRGVLDRWGSQSINEPTWTTPEAPDLYTVAGVDLAGLDPTVPTLRPITRQVMLTPDGPSVSASSAQGGATSAAPYVFNAPDGVMVITSGPGDHGRLRWLDGTEWALASGTQSFCTLPTGCACPNASQDAPVAQPVAAVDVFIGVGPFSGDGPDVALRSLDGWCRETMLTTPPLGAVDTCLVRDWTSTGYQVAEGSATDNSTGGDGARLRFADDGTVTIDLTEVAPVVITTGASGAVTTTTLTYQGRGSGRWGAQDGVVTIAEVPVDALTVRMTVDTEEDGRLTDVTVPLGDARLSSLAPIVGTSRTQCTEVGLTLAGAIPAAAGPAAFTFTGASPASGP